MNRTTHKSLSFLLACSLALCACQPIQLPDTKPEPETTKIAPLETTPAAAADASRPLAAQPHSEWTTYLEGMPVGFLALQEGIVWAGGASVVGVDTRTGELVEIPPVPTLATHALTSMAVGPDGSLWFGTLGAGASRLHPDGTWQHYRTAADSGQNYVSTITTGTNGSIWLGLSSGLIQLHPDGKWTAYTTADGLAGDSIAAITVGLDGSMWFGTEVSGVSHLSVDGTWTSYTTADGLAGPSTISVIVAAPDGSIWFGGIGFLGGYYAAPSGVSRLGPDGQWTRYTSADGLGGDYVSAIAAGPDGSIWFSTLSDTRTPVGEGVSRLWPDGAWTTYTTADGLAGNTIYAIAAAPDGSIWIGTTNGLSRYQPRQ